MNLSIVIPFYNEAGNIVHLKQMLAPIAQQLAEQYGKVELIFIDDGSLDKTWECLQALASENQPEGVSIRLFQHQNNQGLGAALATGFANATGDVIITTDSDATYPFSEIPALLACLTPGVDVVTASPYHPQGGIVGVPAGRLVLSQGASFLYRLLVDPSIHTYTALFRAYRRTVIDQALFSSTGFLAGTELMVRGILMGFNVAEYPTVLHHRKYGVSKARLAQTVLAHLAFLGRILLHRSNLIMLVKTQAVH